MATKTYPLPRGADSDKVVMFSPQVEAIFTETKASHDDQLMVVTVGSLPLGCNELTLVPRRCGDWYCEISAGKKCIAATGDDREAAFAAAARKIEARLAA